MKISSDRTVPAAWRRVLAPVLGSRLLYWLALLVLCAAYLQGGLNKVLDFDTAVAEMRHFNLEPAAPIAAATIALEIGASLFILSGYLRWLAALALAGFTLIASFLANPFWSVMPPERLAMANAFFEHLGLVGGFLLVAWQDVRHRAGSAGLGY
ncbi:MAG TPA: DoxX family protein [Dongiaceae bacterium]|nr:DoxX family protein [Dongiaceae bacterium]